MIAVLVSLLPPLALLLLVIAPAVIELRRPSDVAPLNVPHDHDNRATRFATSYRERLQAMFGAPLAQALLLPAAADAAHAGAMWLCLPQEKVTISSPDMPLICAGDLRLPAGWQSAHEVYAAGDMWFGAGGSARALLADGVVRLGAGSRIARWVHGRDVCMDARSAVGARVSADRRIELSEGAVFVRANAPTISWPAPVPQVASHIDEGTVCDFDGAPNARFDAANRRWIVFRALELPPATRVCGDLIVHGDMNMGERCRIEGSLKVHGRLRMEHDCVITGACVGVRRIEIAAHCRIAGPLIGEGDLRIGSHTVIGELEQPTSVNAQFIALQRDSRVHGTVWAKQQVQGIG